jgi:hypothetical protein
MFRTLDEFPTKDATGEPIKWIGQSFGRMRAEVESLHAKASRLDAGAGDGMVSIWYVAPGAQPDQAIGVEAESEFIAGAWTTGTYFLRFKVTEKGAPIYVRCDATPEAKPSPLAGQAADERRILMREAMLETADQRIAKKDTQIENLTRERNDLTDKLALERRTVEGLKAELAAALEDASPMFDDAGVEQILGLVKLWTEGGDEGRAQGLMAALLARSMLFASSLYEVPEILAAIVAARPEAWTEFATGINEVSIVVAQASKRAPRMIHTAAEMVPLLAAHGVRVASEDVPRARPKVARAVKRKARA